MVSGEQYCWQMSSRENSSYRVFLLLICVGIFSIDLQQNKQTLLIEYQSPFFLLHWLSFGHSSRVCCFVLFVHFWFLGQHFIIHHTTRQCIKSFHPPLDKELHSFSSEWCNFINICQTVGRWMLIQEMIYDIALILLRSELRAPSVGPVFSSYSAGKQCR